MEWIIDLLKEYWWVAFLVIGGIVMLAFNGINSGSDDDYPSCAHGGCY